MKKILVLGITGLVGNTVYKYLKEVSGFQVDGTQRRQKRNSDGTIFFNSSYPVWNILRGYHVIINCIGLLGPYCYDVVKAAKTNIIFPRQLEEHCLKNRQRLIHLSTDEVFDGQRGNYEPIDFTNSRDTYGKTKALGEITRQLTLRASVVGPEYAHKMIGLYDKVLSGNVNAGYTNQFSSTITSLQLAKVIEQVIIRHPGMKGIIQVAGDKISHYDIVRTIRRAYNLDFECSAMNNANPIDRTMIHTIPNVLIPKFDYQIDELVRWMKDESDI